MRFRIQILLVCVATLGAQSCDKSRPATIDSTQQTLRLQSIVAGNLFTCGLDQDRALWCWGANDYGQLGVGDRVDRQQPIRVPIPTPTARLTAGDARVCTVDTLSALRCWGDNVAWALADSTVTFRATPTVLSAGPVRVAAAGSRFTCSTDLAGLASCWGGDRYGELGDGGEARDARVLSQRVASTVAFDTLVAGRMHACGLTANGEAWCWGGEGLTGDGSREKRTVPTRVAGGHRFRSLTAGLSVTCGVADDDAAWCWGLANDGQLGFGELVENKFIPVAVTGGHRFRQLAAGHHRVCGLDLTGLAWCWGTNFNGALGDTGRVSSASPVAVRGTRRYVAIASGDSHACTLDAAGQVWCWGQNSTGDGGGALGDGTVEDRSFPVRVMIANPVSKLSSGR